MADLRAAPTLHLADMAALVRGRKRDVIVASAGDPHPKTGAKTNPYEVYEGDIRVSDEEADRIQALTGQLGPFWIRHPGAAEPELVGFDVPPEPQGAGKVRLRLKIVSSESRLATGGGA